MNKTVSVPALRSFEHEGRSYVRGEVVTTTPRDASILARAGKVSLDKHAAVRAVRAIASTYATRDVKAEEPSDTATGRRRRRNYQRRDMQAETE